MNTPAEYHYYAIKSPRNGIMVGSVSHTEDGAISYLTAVLHPSWGYFEALGYSVVRVAIVEEPKWTRMPELTPEQHLKRFDPTPDEPKECQCQGFYTGNCPIHGPKAIVQP